MPLCPPPRISSSPLAAPPQPHTKDALSALPVLLPVLPAPGRVLPQLSSSSSTTAPPVTGIVLNAAPPQPDVQMVDAM